MVGSTGTTPSGQGSFDIASAFAAQSPFFAMPFVQDLVRSSIQGDLLRQMQEAGVTPGVQQPAAAQAPTTPTAAPPTALPAQGVGGGLEQAAALFRHMLANPTQGLFGPPALPATPAQVGTPTPSARARIAPQPAETPQPTDPRFPLHRGHVDQFAGIRDPDGNITF